MLYWKKVQRQEIPIYPPRSSQRLVKGTLLCKLCGQDKWMLWFICSGNGLCRCYLSLSLIWTYLSWMGNMDGMRKCLIPFAVKTQQMFRPGLIPWVTHYDLFIGGLCELYPDRGWWRANGCSGFLWHSNFDRFTLTWCLCWVDASVSISWVQRHENQLVFEPRTKKL